MVSMKNFAFLLSLFLSTTSFADVDFNPGEKFSLNASLTILVKPTGYPGSYYNDVPFYFLCSDGRVLLHSDPVTYLDCAHLVACSVRPNYKAPFTSDVVVPLGTQFVIDHTVYTHHDDCRDDFTKCDNVAIFLAPNNYLSHFSCGFGYPASNGQIPSREEIIKALMSYFSFPGK